MNILVTGGSSGIGYGICQHFSKLGCKVINFDISVPKNEDFETVQVDVSDVKSLDSAFQNIKKRYPTIDVLISNAGIHLSKKIEDTSFEEYEKVINTNIRGAFFVIKNTLLLMKENGGKIITIGSDQSFIAKHNAAAYGLTKGAIAQLTKNIAIDYAAHNITANCVCPGTIDTPLYRNAIRAYCEDTDLKYENVHQNENKMQPVGRVGKVSEIVDLIDFLVFKSSAFLTGAIIPIDGGYTAR